MSGAHARAVRACVQRSRKRVVTLFNILDAVVKFRVLGTRPDSVQVEPSAGSIKPQSQTDIVVRLLSHVDPASLPPASGEPASAAGGPKARFKLKFGETMLLAFLLRAAWFCLFGLLWRTPQARGSAMTRLPMMQRSTMMTADTVRRLCRCSSIRTSQATRKSSRLHSVPQLR
jgi:hypothetical protein